MAASNDARIWGVMAASGSGKGLWLNDFLRREKPARLVISDFKLEYAEHAPLLVRNLSDVRAAMLKDGDGPLRIRFKSKPGTTGKQQMAEFEGLCRLVQAWQNCCFLAEELSNFTTPSWAPPAWREMTTGGRHENVHIVGVAQNPALIDKTFLSNCTMIHVGPLRQAAHRQAVALSMDVDPGRLAKLVKFQWMEKDFDTGEVTTGWVQIPGKKAPRNAPTGTGPSGTATGAATPGQRKSRAATLGT